MESLRRLEKQYREHPETMPEFLQASLQPQNECTHGCGVNGRTDVCCHGSGWFVERDAKGFQRGELVMCDCLVRKQADRKASFINELKETVSPDMRTWTLKNWPGTDKHALRVASEAFLSRKGIYVFWSKDFGTGKTGLLTAVINSAHQALTPALYASTPELLENLRSGYYDNTYEAQFDLVKTVTVLALDEFHRFYSKKGQGSDDITWAEDKLFQIIDYRYRNAESLLTLVGTNTQPDKGDANPISSRFSDSRVSHIVEVKGADIRPSMAKFDEIQKRRAA